MKPQTSTTSNKPKQRRLRAPVRRERILEAALGVFAERGYHASMGEVAEASGITRTVLYHYFESKQALFLAVLEAQATELLRRIVPITTAGSPQQERLRAGIEASLAFAEEQPRSWDVLFRAGDDDDAEVREARERVQLVSLASLQSLIAEDLAGAGLDTDTAASQLMSEAGLAALIAVVAWWRRNPQHSREEIMELLVPLFWGGLGGVLTGAAPKA